MEGRTVGRTADPAEWLPSVVPREVREERPEDPVGMRADLAEWLPSVVPRECPAGMRVDLAELLPSVVPLEALGVQPGDPVGQGVDLRQEAPVGLRPSVVPQGDRVELRVGHLGVGLVALQKHREVGLKMVDLMLQEVQEVLLVDPVELLPSMVSQEVPGEIEEDLQQGVQAVQGPVQRFRLQRHLQRIQVLPEEGLLPLPWPPIDAPILWRRYHRSRLSLRPP
jgi:hypothetical protein